MKRSPAATLRRTARRAVTWRPKTTGHESLAVLELVSPLRYDVLVRAQLFTLLDRLRHEERAGDADLVAAAREQPYAVWFEKVAMARFRPWVLQDRALFEDQFAERVLRSAALWESFREKGFDARHPVTLRAAGGPLPTDSGVVVDRPLHVADGGHRLALLVAAGLDLTPGMYRIDHRPIARLIDNTATLIGPLGLDEAEHVRFVARGYGADGVEDAEALLSHVRSHAPERLAEVTAVLDAQRRAAERAA